jgi:hypothetical protein
MTRSAATMVAAACTLLAGAATATPTSHRQWVDAITRSLSAEGGDSAHEAAAARTAVRHRAVMSKWAAPAPVAATDPLLRPVDFGADPTGMTDSSAAFDKLLTALLARASSVTVLDNGIADLNGATVDLGGGAYLLSRPFMVPGYYGNFRVINGALRASPSFPPARYLIEVGTWDTCNNPQGSCNVNVGLSGLTLDGGLVAAGGARLMHTMGSVFGPQNFVVNFTACGVNMTGGHGAMIMQTWVGEYLYSAPDKTNASDVTAVGIHLNGNDHVVNDVIVYSARVGILISYAANLCVGAHTWNLAKGRGGIGILVAAPQVRVAECYLDWTDIVIEDPQLTTVVDSFFLCGGRIVLKAAAKGTAHGFYASGNAFNNDYCPSTGTQTVVANETAAAFTAVRDVTVAGSMLFGSVTPAGVTASQTLTSATPLTSWEFDFTDALVFNPANIPIASVSYSVTLDAGQPLVSHAARKHPSNAKVVVETSQAVTGSVTVTVDQSTRSI